MNDTILTKADAEIHKDNLERSIKKELEKHMNGLRLFIKDELEMHMNGLTQYVTARMETLYTEHNILHAAIMKMDENRVNAAKWLDFKARKAVSDRAYKARRRERKLALTNAGGTTSVSSANATTDATRAEGDSPTQPKAERVPPSEGGVK